MEREFQQIVQRYQKEFEQDLSLLVSCRSVRDVEHAGEGAPFGPGIRLAFETFGQIAQRCGLTYRDLEGYACEAGLDSKEKSEDYIAVLGHLDVVSEGELCSWKTEPFCLTKKEGVWYGRGVNDDKGPLLAGLYAVRILKDMGIELKENIRVIAGGAEETTWECMKYYFSKNRQPLMGFSPDGNFPYVNGEKGIVKFELIFPEAGNKREHPEIRCKTLENYVCDDIVILWKEEGEEQSRHFQGKRALSRNPQRGVNVLWELADWMYQKQELRESSGHFTEFVRECLSDDFYGNKSGLYASDEEMGQTSVCPTGVIWKEDGLHLYLDIRYPKSTTQQRIEQIIADLGTRFGFEAFVTDKKRLLYVPPQSRLIGALKQAYEKVTGRQAHEMTKGGASYARVLDCGVAFGATAEGEETHPHMPNECMAVSSLLKAMEIYCEALVLLAGK